MAGTYTSKLVVVLLLGFVVGTWARMAFILPDGAEQLLNGPYQKTFSCDQRNYGYYADVANACKIFHICQPILDGATRQVLEIAHFTFVCGNQTIFNQESLTCTNPEDSIPCDQAPGYYDLINSEFGKLL